VGLACSKDFSCQKEKGGFFGVFFWLGWGFGGGGGGGVFLWSGGEYSYAAEIHVSLHGVRRGNSGIKVRLLSERLESVVI